MSKPARIGSWNSEYVTGTYLVLSAAGLACAIVAFVYTQYTNAAMYATEDYVEDFCCRTGWELPTALNGGCASGKSELLNRFSDGTGLPTTLIQFCDVTWIFALVFWLAVFLLWLLIAVYSYLLKKALGQSEDLKRLFKTRRAIIETSLLFIVVVGAVTVILLALNYGFSSFMIWDDDYALAGCCCCANVAGTACDVTSGCNSTVTGCLSPTAMAQSHPGNTIMPLNDNPNGFNKYTTTALATGAASYFILVIATLILWKGSQSQDGTISYIATSNDDNETEMKRVEVGRGLFGTGARLDAPSKNNGLMF